MHSQEQRNAVAAIRVSTTKQGVDGDSPEDQKRQIEQFAASRGIAIKEVFLFLESGSKTIQPMQQAINYCKDPKNKIDLFLIKSIDRFTRGGATFYDSLKSQLDACEVALVDIYGVIGSQKINTLEHLGVSYDWSVFNPTKKAEMLEAERAKDEIRDIMSRMIGAQIRYARMGYWVRRPLFGFNNQHVETSDGKRCILTPHPVESPWVIKMFKLRARGTMDDAQIVDAINKLGYITRKRVVRDKSDRTRIVEEIGGEPLTLKVLWHTLENPVYTGVNPEKWTQDKPVKCKFDGLVSIDLFNKANKGKIVISEASNGEISIYRRQPPEYLVKKGVRHPDFPYKRIVMCSHCGKPLYGSASRGKLGKYYPAYHCNKRGHYFRVSKKDFDETITRFVQGLRISPEYIEALTSTVLAEWDRRQAEMQKDDLSLEARIKELRSQIKAAVDKIKFLTSEITIKYMEEEIMKAEAEIAELELEKAKIKEEPAQIGKVVAYVRYFLEHLDKLLLQQSDPVAKANFFAVLFDKLPTYQDLLSGTPELEPVIGVNQLFIQQKLDVNTHGWG